MRQDEHLSDKLVSIIRGPHPSHGFVVGIFSRLVSGLGISTAELSELLGITHSELTRFLEGRFELSITSLYQLCAGLNISCDQLLSLSFDWSAAESFFRGKVSAIPDKYLEDPQSRVLTTLNLLNFVEAEYGSQIKATLLRRLQLTESMFKDPWACVNLKLALDFIKNLVEITQDTNAPFRAGRHSANTVAALGAQQQFTDIRTQRDVFDFLFSKGAVKKLIESNREWKIDKERNGVIHLSARIPEYALDHVEGRYLYSLQGDLVRMGYLCSMPAYVGLPSARVMLLETATVENPISRFAIFTSAVSA